MSILLVVMSILITEDLWLDPEAVIGGEIKYTPKPDRYEVVIYLSGGQIVPCASRKTKQDCAEVLLKIKQAVDERRMNYNRMITAMWHAPGMPGTIQAEREFNRLQDAMNSSLDDKGGLSDEPPEEKK